MSTALALTPRQSVAPKKRKPGRPPKYTRARAEQWCQLIERNRRGIYSLYEEFKGVYDLVSPVTLYRWMDGEGFTSADERSWFLQRYARARATQGTELLAEAQEIMDRADGNSMSQVKKAQEQAAIRLKLAQMLAPEKYGPRATVEHTHRVDTGVMVVPASAGGDPWADADVVDVEALEPGESGQDSPDK